MTHVEPKGEFKPEPLLILDQRSLILWNQAIEKAKVYLSHYGLEESTWEMNKSMRETFPFLFVG